MLAAVQSTKVAQEHEDDGVVEPQVAESVLFAVGVGERNLGQRAEIH